MATLLTPQLEYYYRHRTEINKAKREFRRKHPLIVRNQNNEYRNKTREHVTRYNKTYWEKIKKFRVRIDKVSNAYLIAELEKRRGNKCGVCGHPQDAIEVCQDCLWSFGNIDNFKDILDY